MATTLLFLDVDILTFMIRNCALVIATTVLFLVVGILTLMIRN